MSALAARVGVGGADVRDTLAALAIAAAAVAAALGWYDVVEIPRPRLLAALVACAGVARLALWPRPLPDPHQSVVLLAVVAMAALQAATMVETRSDSLLGIAGVVALGAALRRRPAVAFVLALFFAGFYASLESLFEVEAYRLHDALFGAFIVAGVLAYLSAGRDRRPVPVAGVLLFAAFIVAARISAELAPNPAIGNKSFYASAWFMIAAVAVAYSPWPRATHARFMKGALVVVALVAGYAVLRWIIGPAEAERRFVLSDPVAAPYLFAEGKLRVFGSFPHTHALGVWCAVVLPFCTALAIHLRGRWRAVAIGAGGLAFAALIGSGARAAAGAAGLGCLAVTVVMAYTRAGRGVRIGVLAAAGAALVIGFTVIAAVSPDQRTSDRSYARILDPGSDRSYQVRLYKWRQALDDVDDHPFGRGLGTAGQTAVTSQRFASVALYDVDNSYLKIAIDQGIFGLGLYVAALVAMLVGLLTRALRATDRQAAALGAAAAGALGAFMILMWTGNYIEGRPAFTAWAIVGLGLAQFATRPRRRTPPASAHTQP